MNIVNRYSKIVSTVNKLNKGNKSEWLRKLGELLRMLYKVINKLRKLS